ncbi:phosphotransferase [Photobacterium damselae]|uniref:phosphotransferase n=1 Tax=Photobacterium damselae TaxID=38293 RepID=UPI001EFEEA83|nr:phosphotransferase family protein [Photobacterium damselae]
MANKQFINGFDADIIPNFQITSAIPLSGGLTNRCWKLTGYYQGRLLIAVWRPVSAISQAFLVDRQQEFLTLQQLSASLAPLPIYCNNQGLLVEWLEGKEAGKETSDSEILELLVQIHQQPLPQTTLDLKQRCQYYWDQIPVELHSHRLLQLHSWFAHSVIPESKQLACCHCDLGRYNLIRKGSRLKVIDWEYAAAGDALLDLALTILANDMSIERAVTQYCQLTKSEYNVILTQVNTYLPWGMWLAILWYYIGYEQWQDSEYLNAALALKQELIQRLRLADDT